MDLSTSSVEDVHRAAQPGYDRTVEARTVSRDVVTSRDHPGVLRTGVTMFAFVAVIVGSWALVIGAVWLLLRLLT